MIAFRGATPSFEPVLEIGNFGSRHIRYTLSQAEKDLSNGKIRPWLKLLDYRN